ncbi:triphosphoribosyl-dephospho-CoA synthase [Maioricimonas rarisocia]|uniref:Triphosphoribosyl-dephospho-CoA synthase n=1 Tax=Maioricimonas rarisocia TaxID=2528026 RepID=A0A517Z5V7_9PLAN|nr:triphosphoribosyl-dephospho-CoA synthase [Maioricimonas rarisocia]QDU37845.1 triphosphoribosyl-dephospho-CoA synthase [Maioricimonas rarisocia]
MHPDIETLQRWIRIACLAEARARKPGNVHPGASFQDLTYEDFVRSAHAASPVLARGTAGTLGQTICKAVEATQAEVRTNTNLGICLLLAPMVAAVRNGDLRAEMSSVLAGTTCTDAAWVYRAIRTAVPGGLGKVDEQDVADEPTETLLEVMQRAADRDRVAWQYAHGFRDIFEIALPCLEESVDDAAEERIVGLHLRLMSQIPDTLIARKCGVDVAKESAERAAAVLSAGWPGRNARSALAGLDAWLRADGHRRNPGTTADLVAASLFAALVEGVVTEEQVTF